MTLKNLIILIIAALLLVGGAFYFLWMQERGSGEFDQFAMCLKDKGALFYGAFWCTHCQSQKALFGSSKRYLPYIECSTPDSQGQLQVCKDQQIAVYPTWKFTDGSKVEGELSLRELADKTGCQLPQ